MWTVIVPGPSLWAISSTAPPERTGSTRRIVAQARDGGAANRAQARIRRAFNNLPQSGKGACHRTKGAIVAASETVTFLARGYQRCNGRTVENLSGSVPAHPRSQCDRASRSEAEERRLRGKPCFPLLFTQRGCDSPGDRYALLPRVICGCGGVGIEKARGTSPGVSGATTVSRPSACAHRSARSRP